MRTWTLGIILLMLGGCPWVTEEEYDQYWDSDGDGWGIDEDCAPNDARIYPYAADVRGDGCDSDCGMEADADGDDWPDDADCDPNDATVYPCSLHETQGDDKDSDCDGDPDRVRTEPCLDGDPDFPDAEAIVVDDCPYLAAPSEGGEQEDTDQAE